jgi:hypothetical protein
MTRFFACTLLAALSVSQVCAQTCACKRAAGLRAITRYDHLADQD